MGRRIRVIPVLSINEGQLVKTIQFKRPNYLGDPINAIKILNDKEVDEIAVVDIRASQDKTLPNYSLIQEMAGECFMPLAYGGGVSNYEIAKKVFDLGVEKIILNTSLLNNLNVPAEIAATFGEQSVVGSIDIGKSLFRKDVLKFSSGNKSSKENIVSFAKTLVENGVGEIFINCIQNEGTFSGYNISVISEIANAVSVPVVAYGGAAKISDFVKAVSEGGASAVAASSMFVYKNNNTNSILINYPNQQLLTNELYNKIE